MKKPEKWAVLCTEENRDRLYGLFGKLYKREEEHSTLPLPVDRYYGKYVDDEETPAYASEPEGATILTIDQAEHFFLKGFDVWFEEEPKLSSLDQKIADLIKEHFKREHDELEKKESEMLKRVIG